MNYTQPKNDLTQLQADIRGKRLKVVYTRSALEGAATIGYSKADILETILKLKHEHFHKATDAEKFPGEIMDVYRFPDPDLLIYVKFHVSGVVVVSSCKEK
jgi:hypothetical protein